MPHLRRALLNTLTALLILGVLIAVFRPGGPLVGQAGTDLIGGSFTLVDQSGATVTEESWPGQFRFLYFGFTYCPDICPTALLSMANVLDQLGPLSGRVQPIFITVDPERDTPEALAAYVAAFHPRFVGLSGTPAQIEAAARAYQVTYERVARPGSSDYLVDHSSIIYLMDPDGRYVTHFNHLTDPTTMARSIRTILEDRPADGPPPPDGDDHDDP
ncbi:MAG: SCO family protein [Alphaproteobacteria bacterium]